MNEMEYGKSKHFYTIKLVEGKKVDLWLDPESTETLRNLVDIIVDKDPGDFKEAKELIAHIKSQL